MPQNENLGQSSLSLLLFILNPGFINSGLVRSVPFDDQQDIPNTSSTSLAQYVHRKCQRALLMST